MRLICFLGKSFLLLLGRQLQITVYTGYWQCRQNLCGMHKNANSFIRSLSDRFESLSTIYKCNISMSNLFHILISMRTLTTPVEYFRTTENAKIFEEQNRNIKWLTNQNKKKKPEEFSSRVENSFAFGTFACFCLLLPMGICHRCKRYFKTECK